MHSTLVFALPYPLAWMYLVKTDTTIWPSYAPYKCFIWVLTFASKIFLKDLVTTTGTGDFTLGWEKAQVLATTIVCSAQRELTWVEESEWKRNSCSKIRVGRIWVEQSGLRGTKEVLQPKPVYIYLEACPAKFSGTYSQVNMQRTVVKVWPPPLCFYAAASHQLATFLNDELKAESSNHHIATMCWNWTLVLSYNSHRSLQTRSPSSLYFAPGRMGTLAFAEQN